MLLILNIKILLNLNIFYNNYEIIYLFVQSEISINLSAIFILLIIYEYFD